MDRELFVQNIERWCAVKGVAIPRLHRVRPARRNAGHTAERAGRPDRAVSKVVLKPRRQSPERDRRRDAQEKKIKKVSESDTENREGEILWE